MRRWGQPPFWSSLRRDGGHTGTVVVCVCVWGGGVVSRRPHDLFKPGGTCASQPLMAAITLPAYGRLNPEKKDKCVASRKINIRLLL